jgi:hypothetical protein
MWRRSTTSTTMPHWPLRVVCNLPGSRAVNVEFDTACLCDAAMRALVVVANVSHHSSPDANPSQTTSYTSLVEVSPGVVRRPLRAVWRPF